MARRAFTRNLIAQSYHSGARGDPAQVQGMLGELWREYRKIRNIVMLLIFVPIFLLALAAFFGPPAVSKPAVAAIKTIAVVMDRSTPPQVAAPPVRCWHDSIGAAPSAYTLDEPMTPDGYPTTSLDRVSIRGWLTVSGSPRSL